MGRAVLPSETETGGHLLTELVKARGLLLLRYICVCVCVFYFISVNYINVRSFAKLWGRAGSFWVHIYWSSMLSFLQWTLLTVCTLSLFSRVWLFATLWAVDLQAPLSMGFSRQEYWSELPCLPSRDLPEPGIEPASLSSAALALVPVQKHSTHSALYSHCFISYVVVH